jgi:hypothetical protein
MRSMASRRGPFNIMNRFQADPSGNNPVWLDEDALSLDRSGKIHLRVMCAWCGEIIKDEPGPVSHGMCPECRDAFLATVPGA